MGRGWGGCDAATLSLGDPSPASRRRRGVAVSAGPRSHARGAHRRSRVLRHRAPDGATSLRAHLASPQLRARHARHRGRRIPHPHRLRVARPELDVDRGAGAAQPRTGRLQRPDDQPPTRSEDTNPRRAGLDFARADGGSSRRLGDRRFLDHHRLLDGRAGSAVACGAFGDRRHGCAGGGVRAGAGGGGGHPPAAAAPPRAAHRSDRLIPGSRGLANGSVRPFRPTRPATAAGA